MFHYTTLSQQQGLTLIQNKKELNNTITDWLSLSQISGPELFLTILGYDVRSNNQKVPTASIAFACQPTVLDPITVTSTKAVPIGTTGVVEKKTYDLLSMPAIQLPWYNCKA